MIIVVFAVVDHSSITAKRTNRNVCLPTVIIRYISRLVEIRAWQAQKGYSIIHLHATRRVPVSTRITPSLLVLHLRFLWLHHAGCCTETFICLRTLHGRIQRYSSSRPVATCRRSSSTSKHCCAAVVCTTSERRLVYTVQINPWKQQSTLKSTCATTDVGGAPHPRILDCDTAAAAAVRHGAS